jgi:hypothetical protein
MSDANKKANSERMKCRNPMKDKATAEKVSQKTKGKTQNKSAAGLKAISDAARKRMLSDKNPMKGTDGHRKAMEKIFAHKAPSKNEIHFRDWCEQNQIQLEWTGNALLWIGRKNPDFRVPLQKKAVEVT